MSPTLELSHQFTTLLFQLIFYATVPTIFIPIFYVAVEDNVVNSILSRIYNVNFTYSLKHSISLLIGYIAGSYFIAYTIRDILEAIYSGIPLSNSIENKINIYAIAFSSVTFCFITRIVSRQHGFIKGKQVYSVLSSMAIIMFFINLFIGTYTIATERALEPITVIKSVFLYPISLYESFIFQYIIISKYFVEIFPIILVSSLAAASLGELVILSLDPHFRSVPTVLEKFPSDFELIPSDKIRTKLNELITIEDLRSLKLTSRSLITCEILYKNIKLLLETNNPPEITIIAPEYEIPSTKLGIRAPTKLTKLLNGKKLNQFNDKVVMDYRTRCVRLNEMVEDGKITWVKEDLNDFKMIIVNNRKVLLVVKAGDNTDRRVGIYSEEPYIVETCVNLFSCVSHKIEILSIIEKIELFSLLKKSIDINFDENKKFDN